MSTYIGKFQICILKDAKTNNMQDIVLPNLFLRYASLNNTPYEGGEATQLMGTVFGTMVHLGVFARVIWIKLCMYCLCACE